MLQKEFLISYVAIDYSTGKTKTRLTAGFAAHTLLR